MESGIPSLLSAISCYADAGHYVKAARLLMKLLRDKPNLRLNHIVVHVLESIDKAYISEETAQFILDTDRKYYAKQKSK